MPNPCDFCGDTETALFLMPRCHPLAPLRAVKDGDMLVLRCYVPECDREVARLQLATPKTEDWSSTIGPRLRALADRPIYTGLDLKSLREELRALAAESEAP